MIISEQTYNVKHFSWHGIVVYQEAGECAVVELFGIPVFERVGLISCLLGVDWAQA